MCELCDMQKKTFTASAGSRRRLKLWELRSHFHCAILGTCLSMDELRKVMRQSGMSPQGRLSDYDLHSIMVTQAEEKSRISQTLHKMLDRKHRRWIQLLAKCRERSELEQHWREAMENGDIAGIFWALMTHPYAVADQVRQAYEDVHMLSHLQGASNRADLKRMKCLEEKVTELQDALGRARKNHHEQITWRDELIRQHEALALKHAMTRHAPGDGDDCADSDVGRENRLLSRRLSWAEEKLAERDIRIAGLTEEMAGVRELLEESREEHAAMERAMTLMLAQSSDRGREPGFEIDLQGRRVLYVGGRSALAPHLRSLVEACNGRFEHHDGGLEDSRAGLQCTLAGADMVFCPTDCVSHDACRRVKRHCQQQAKQFIPLRSSGLSAFAAGLQYYMSTGTDTGSTGQAVANQGG